MRSVFRIFKNVGVGISKLPLNVLTGTESKVIPQSLLLHMALASVASSGTGLASREGLIFSGKNALYF